jgi:hypothetical protein
VGGLKKPNFAVRCPIRATYVANGSPSLKSINVFAYRPVFVSNSPFDVILTLVQPTKVFRVSKSATFARG